jgi:hypothetical protein
MGGTTVNSICIVILVILFTMWILLITSCIVQCSSINNKYVKKLLCDILAWHRVKDKNICELCKKKCLQDSQGNWFTMED